MQPPVLRDCRAHDQKPMVSIVIPAFNRARFLPECIAPLLAQTYPLDRYEIILVDDGSTDDSGAVARQCARAWPGKFAVLSKPNGGPASARNAGIHASTADIIAFIDSDCVAAPDWLECLVAVLTTTATDGVGGPIRNCGPSGWVSSYLDSRQFYRHRVRHGQVDYLLTANVAFRRSALQAVAGFTERPGVWGEDADLSFRLKQVGYRLALSSKGRVTHHGTPTSVWALMSDLFRYGRGNYLLSHNWTNGRTPPIELLRHAAAFELALWIALGRARSVGLWTALTYWPLILMEHGAFIAGMLSGMVNGGRERRA